MLALVVLLPPYSSVAAAAAAAAAAILFLLCCGCHTICTAHRRDAGPEEEEHNEGCPSIHHLARGCSSCPPRCSVASLITLRLLRT